MADGPDEELVLVQFEYEYRARDGALVSIKPNERFLLLSRTNEHWWHVRRDRSTKPFYVPAKYVKELPPDAPRPLGGAPAEGRRSPDPPKEPAGPLDRWAGTVTIRVHPPANCCDKAPEVRMSTFGIPQELCWPPRLRADSLVARHTYDSESRVSSSKDSSNCIKRHSLAASVELSSCTVPDNRQNLSQKPRLLGSGLPDPARKPTRAKPVEAAGTKSAERKADVEPPEAPKEQRRHSDATQVPENVYETIEDVTDRPRNSLGSAPDSLPAPVSIPALVVTLAPALALAPAPAPATLPGSVPAPGPGPSPAPDDPGPQPAQAHSSSPSPSDTIYVNVAELREGLEQLPPPPSPSPSPSPSPLPLPSPSPPHPSLDLDGWETHTDQESGRDYYYHPGTGRSTWEPPFSCPADQELPPEPLSSPSPSPSPLLSPTDSDWEQLLDESSGRHYFYNHVSGETTWEPPEQFCIPSRMDAQDTRRLRDDGAPPLPEEDYPADSQDEPGALVSFPRQQNYSHVKRVTIPRASLDSSAPGGWTRSMDMDGTWVFTNDVTHEQWVQSLDDRGQTYYYLKDGSRSQWHLPEVPVPSGKPRVGNGLNQEGVSVPRSWRHTMGPTQLSSSHDDLVLEKAGILNKTKVCENGKKVRKNWSQSWTVLHGGVLTFHKDPKSTAAGASNKTNQIVPEFTVELRGATIGWASKDKSSKKNVLELKTRTGAEFLIQYDTDSIINDWHKVITDTIRQLEQPCEEEGGEPMRRASTRPGTLGSDPEQKKVRTKLLKFLQKRPTLQSVKEKGYIRDSVFGCALSTLCALERTTIPSFVEKCVSAVERRGLDIDGIYRVSGNLAVIQKLRYKADHEELDLEDGQWEDVHVITGALKLFFRELPEPLFPYSHFNNFIAAIKISDYGQKVSYMRDLVKSLPQPNHDTMELLFRHLRRVIEYGEENRMTVQNVAIVFGPTLLRPETESANITMHMVFQNQIVELILNEYEQIFCED
ncbi:rho GTPase-activating protein 12-like isoform X2 [Scleropages formosus]|uniref:Rho GTPase activating protein 27 n=1 Tax=Scleropages formosus TaxID=113540 RepID=A0A8C9REP3_SCLFO|nr:rho GTPase-activating protein 12 isoform X2 [Scleropages formosus]